MTHRSMPTARPESSTIQGLTVAGWIGIGLMVASLFFVAFAAIEAMHRHAPEAAANFEIAVFLLLVGGLWLWRARVSAERAVRLASSGIATAGVVTGMAKTWYQDETGATRYAVRFTYQDEQGRAHRGTAICAQTDALQWRTGDRGLVRYDLEHPGRSVWIGQGLETAAARESTLQPASEHRAPSSIPAELPPPSLRHLVARSNDLRGAVLPVILFCYVGVLTLVFWNRPNWSAASRVLLSVVCASSLLRGVAGIARGVRQVRSWARLLRDGVPAEATVTAVLERARFFGRPMPNAIMTTSWTIEYRYPDDVGRSRRGASDATRREALALRPGDTIAIKYDRDGPARGQAQDAGVWIGKLADRQ